MEKINELKEKGIITNEEFIKEKEKILARNSNISQNSNEGKSKILAGLLGVFLGVFGIHNFYLGYTGKAVTQLLITILSIGFLSWISAIWGLIEGIMILVGEINKDGKGNPLRG